MLENDGVVAYPTDSLYALGCLPTSKKAVLKLCRIKGIDPAKADLTLMCSDISQVSSLTKPMDKETFRLIHKNTPGPVTFILPASKEAQTYFKNRKRTIGIRIPDYPFVKELVDKLSSVLLTTSIARDYMEVEDPIDDMIQRLQSVVDLFILDEQYIGEPSTVVDCTVRPPEVLRQGRVNLE